MARGFVLQDLWTMEQLPFAGSPLPAFESDTSLAQRQSEWCSLGEAVLTSTPGLVTVTEEML